MQANGDIDVVGASERGGSEVDLDEGFSRIKEIEGHEGLEDLVCRVKDSSECLDLVWIGRVEGGGDGVEKGGAGLAGAVDADLGNVQRKR